ncbi:MAG: putative symporter YjmB [Firmicutes bacterium ADurb.Bin262]|nr:MAG: putative symporter YjmB [Firmicutes bacterium ADurb.Bin262]
MRSVPLVAGMYIATYVLGEQTLRVFGRNIVLGGAALNTALIAGWAVTGYLGMLLTPKICARLNYRQIYYISGITGIAVSLLLLAVPKNIYTVFFAMLLVGLPSGVTANINYSMIADSVDYVEWKTGRRSEGVTVSFQTLMNKAMTALQSALVSLSLVIFQFKPPVEKAGELVVQAQNKLTMTGFIMMMTVIPAAGWLLSMIPMRYYDFIGARHVEAHKAILRRREEAAGKDGGAT